MPEETTERFPWSGPRFRTRTKGGVDLFRFLRRSHIFSSAVEEILERKMLSEVTPLPLTLSQFQLLALMSINGGYQVGEVAGFLGLSSPAISKSVDKLERMKLLVRIQSTGDRRATLLAASLKGRELVQKYEKLKAERISSIIDEFDPTEIEKLSELLLNFSLAMIKREGNPDDACLRCVAYIDTRCPVRQIRGGCPYQEAKESRARKDASRKSAVASRGNVSAKPEMSTGE